MRVPPLAWTRVAPFTVLFLLAFAAILWNWTAEPPLSGDLVATSRGRNMAGDLAPVLSTLFLQFVVALVALQPFRREPRLRWVGLVGMLYTAWSVLGLLAGMHAPPIAAIQNAFTFIIGVLLTLTALALLFETPPRPRLDRPT